MTFWQDDAAALLADFGLTLTHAGGDTTKAILDDEEVVEQDNVGGERLVRQRVFRFKTGDLPAAAVGDMVTYETVEYLIRDVPQREDDGVLSRMPVVPK